MNSIHYEDISLFKKKREKKEEIMGIFLSNISMLSLFFCGLVVKKFCGHVSKLYSDAGKSIIHLV